MVGFPPLSTIYTVLRQADPTAFRTDILLSYLSRATLQAICTMGLSDIPLTDPVFIIAKFEEQCNTGRNSHVWRQQFSLRLQREKESADSWVMASIQQLKQNSKLDAKSTSRTSHQSRQRVPRRGPRAGLLHLMDAGIVDPTRSTEEQTAQPAAKNANAAEN
ncbi:hypothetical protein OUZ56_026098 [Daphnia magna]|uniref:Uncharacterized protein n=1 Tax=Daphnia magna TaxID=35525 RepID=A0ABQ9ZKV6_9CRUS|nr:hypothetical protein OUZ56_026098 [Daphnia magna]